MFYNNQIIKLFNYQIINYIRGMTNDQYKNVKLRVDDLRGYL